MNFLAPGVYQPIAWLAYHQIREQILTVLPSARIEHIGSSSMEGTVSKGDLDVFVGVAQSSFEHAIGVLQSLQFKIKENTLRTDALCAFESYEYPLDVGIQLVATGSEFECFLVFRDLINGNEDLRDRYNQLKVDATGLDPQEYRTIKSKFIESLLKREHTEPA
jgi:GrpB-like predicted nucleotidyltransferase (UPF0157 family)